MRASRGAGAKEGGGDYCRNLVVDGGKLAGWEESSAVAMLRTRTAEPEGVRKDRMLSVKSCTSARLAADQMRTLHRRPSEPATAEILGEPLAHQSTRIHAVIAVFADSCRTQDGRPAPATKSTWTQSSCFGSRHLVDRAYRLWLVVRW